MLNYAIGELEDNKYDRIVWIRNNVDVEGVKDIGALPNSMEDKLKPFAMPIADILGSEQALDNHLMDDTIRIEHLGFLRGRSFDNSIIYVSEVQNNTPEQIKTIISRAGENTIVLLNGDLSQVDIQGIKAYNGIHALQRLRGESLFGQVSLDRVERSETARLAEKVMGGE